MKCPNKHFGCLYKTNKISDLQKHIRLCKDPKVLREHFHCQQIEFGPRFHPIHQLKQMTSLRQEPEMNTFVFFDIESLCRSDPQIVGQSEVLSTHMLLSIAANAYIDGEHVTKCWVRKNKSY